MQQSNQHHDGLLKGYSFKLYIVIKNKCYIMAAINDIIEKK